MTRPEQDERVNHPSPLVSVVIPAYNAARTIGRALQSALIQDYAPLEVIVVVDGSMDNTGDVVGSVGDPRIRLIILDKNRGECGAMNVGIENADGKYVAFLDADDEWLPGKIRKQVAIIETNPNITFVVCDSITIAPDGTSTASDAAHAPMIEGPEAWRALLAYSFVAKPCVLARTACLRALGGFDPALRVGGDQDMWIRLALAGEVGCLDEPLVRIYDTPGSLMKTYSRGGYDYLLPMIRKHLAEQRHLLGEKEYNRILRERLSGTGRRLCWHGYYLLGARLLLEAMARGHDIPGNAARLVRASPLARLLRRMIQLT